MGDEIPLKKSYLRVHWTEISVTDEGACQVLPAAVKKNISSAFYFGPAAPCQGDEIFSRSSDSVQGNIWALNNIPEHSKHTPSKNKCILKTIFQLLLLERILSTVYFSSLVSLLLAVR